MIEKVIIALNGEIDRLIKDHGKKIARAEKSNGNQDHYDYYIKHANLISDRIKHYKELINYLETIK